MGAVASVFGSGGSPDYTPPEPPKPTVVNRQPETPVDTAAAAAAADARRSRSSGGRKRTILTDPSGLDEAASTAKKTILGT